MVDQVAGRRDDRELEASFSRETPATTARVRASRAAGRGRSRAGERAVTRAGGSDRHTGVPAGVRDEGTRTGAAAGLLPLLLFDVFRWLAELVATALEIPGVRITLLAIVLAGVFYATRVAAWLQIAGSWLRMAAMIGGVAGLAIVAGMATGAIAVDVATLVGLLEELLEVLQ